MRTSKILAAILAALMLAPTMAACSQTDDSDDKGSVSSTSGNESTTVDTTTAEPEPTLSFEKENNGNKSFHIMTLQETDYEYDGDTAGDRLSSAVYDRNLAVEEYLGIKLDIRYESGSWANRNQYNTMVKQSIEANDGSIDYATGMISCIVPIVSTQYFMNVLDLPYLDVKNDWWVESTPINGKQLTLMGNVQLSMYKGLSVVLFNKELVSSDAALENPYELVNSGKWTYDKFIEQAAGHGNDVNGDGVYEFGTDVFSLAADGNAWRSWNAALETHTAGIDDDGNLVINTPDDRLVNAASKFINYWSANSDIAIVSDYDQRSSAFAADKVIYCITKLDMVDYLADMESDFGIVPMPKYDEDQKEYHTPIAGASGIIVVPNTIADPALVGKTLEALSFFSDDVVTAYYESTLKERYSRDPESSKMLNLVRSGVYDGPDYLYATTLGSKQGVTTNCTVFPDCCITYGWEYNLMSCFEQNITSWNANIEKILEAYADPEE